jgi:pimeloyl-ACP methyl ester carboxylesterase
MGFADSPDGTRIFFRTSGSGPPVVLVHGATASHVRWKPVVPALEEHFTVHAVDRRGRGESGDRDDYAIEREFEDVAAVVDAAGTEVDVVGHSSGGLYALEAALLAGNVRKLVLYEPAITPELLRYPPEFVARLEGLLEAGDREGIISTFAREIVRMTEDDLARFKGMPAWPERVKAAHTIPRELRTMGNYEFVPERFRNLDTPTLLLQGGDSPDSFTKGIEVLDATLPNSQVAVLPGQQHIAMDTAPELFAREVLGFLH